MARQRNDLRTRSAARRFLLAQGEADERRQVRASTRLGPRDSRDRPPRAARQRHRLGEFITQQSLRIEDLDGVFTFRAADDASQNIRIDATRPGASGSMRCAGTERDCRSDRR